MKLLRDRLRGLKETFAFNNWWAIILQRLFRPSDAMVSYRWKDKWWIVCDARLSEPEVVKDLLARGSYRPWIRRSIREGRLSYVNIGAHIGAFDLAVAGEGVEVPMALSIELNPITFSKLNFNLAINDLRQVRTLSAGIAGTPGQIHFSPSACSLGDNLFTPQDEAEGTEVLVLTLATAVEGAGLNGAEFDLLKLDCEGAEYGIVAGSPPELLRRFRHIVAELHAEKAGESEAALCAKLADCGFRAEQSMSISVQAPELRFWTRVEQPK